MSSTTYLLLLLISATLLSSTTAASTAYEVLESYDFPAGLLPKGVIRYELDKDTGLFNVYLNKTCRFTVNHYDIKLNDKISCTIERDEIKNLQGVQVGMFLQWIDIIAVEEDDEEVEFTIGNGSASFPVYYFYESPECGRGFDYVNSGTGNRSRKVLE